MTSILAATTTWRTLSSTANIGRLTRSRTIGRAAAHNGSTTRSLSASALTFAGLRKSMPHSVAKTMATPINRRIAQFSTASGIQYTKKGRPGPGEGFQVNFVMQDGEEISVQAHEGESLLDVAWANDIDIEGACEASLACSTCHLILDEDSFSKLEEPTDEENDMLDLAFGLTDTSRLGCQVLMNKDLDGIIARLPSVTRNVSV
ncbi:hypothetical protein KVV02_002430 [Mortierella alpina]|uniref:2Fe-2S ferredoxin-type domain-containing protein n=1 Tax=Mortierella alpina TaxID=64518 RepID=A0A9P7ZXW9_MORAP|nr:hypothetical protein KVV02_002430 [Mortierella alpina]